MKRTAALGLIRTGGLIRIELLYNRWGNYSSGNTGRIGYPGELFHTGRVAKSVDFFL